MNLRSSDRPFTITGPGRFRSCRPRPSQGFCRAAAAVPPTRPAGVALVACDGPAFRGVFSRFADRYQAKYGRWRSIIRRSVAAFLKCGDLHHGFARVRCGDCGHEMFVSFSCKQRCTCPSCHQERALATSIPHRGRGLFAHRASASGVHHSQTPSAAYPLRPQAALRQGASCAWTCIRAEVCRLLGRDDVLPGMVAAIQTHGSLG